MTESWRQVPLWLSPLCYVMFALISMVFFRCHLIGLFSLPIMHNAHISSRLCVYFQKLPNIYGTLIHCENLLVLKIIEMMFTVQIIVVKSVHYA